MGGYLDGFRRGYGLLDVGTIDSGILVLLNLITTASIESLDMRMDTA